MSLSSRISAFFLVALALVLAGFSGTLYLLARTYLVRQLDDHLESALDILEASVDIEPGGLEWEPTDRQMTLGVGRDINAVRWVVRDDRGIVDRSANALPDRFPGEWAPTDWPREPSDGTAFGGVSGWRLASRRLRIEELLRQGRGHPDDEPGFEEQYPTLILVVGLEPAPVKATMERLGLTLVSLSFGIWTFALAVGRWLCRRALMPVTLMARSATSMTASELGRLPITSTGDELEELGRAFNGLLDRLNGAFVRLNEAYEQRSRFAGDASHQLRTPLAALLGQIQVARRHDRSAEEYRRVLELVQVEGMRLRQIIESLLTLVQPERADVETPKLDLRSWTGDHLRRFSSHPRASDLRVELGDEPLIVQADPSLVAQILDNLLENAFKYSTEGTSVLVRAGRERDSAVLSVEDQGWGISPEDLAHVFEPFFRTEQARRSSRAGVGLGLAVARRIADSLGGSIEIRSESRAGSCFLLRLPVKTYHHVIECGSDRRRYGNTAIAPSANTISTDKM